jgi:hypothetical protein
VLDDAGLVELEACIAKRGVIGKACAGTRCADRTLDRTERRSGSLPCRRPPCACKYFRVRQPFHRGPSAAHHGYGGKLP